MTKKQKYAPIKTAGAFVLMTLAAATLAACTRPESARPVSYNESHPIQVAREQVTVTIALPEGTQRLSAEDARRFQSFLRDYVQRGRTQVNVETALPGVARNILVANGFRNDELNFIDAANIPAPNAILSFTANTALVPDCGDWSKNTSFDPGNEHFANFGCANRRNIGLMISDPGDMIQSQPMSGGGAARRDTTMDLYNSGEAVGAPPAVDAQAVSGAATGD